MHPFNLRNLIWSLLLLLAVPAYSQVARTTPGTVMVKLQAGHEQEGRALLERFSATFAGAAYQQKFPRAEKVTDQRSPDGQPLVDLTLVYELTFAPQLSSELVLRHFQGQPAIQYAEPVYEHELLYTPNDPLASTLQVPYLTQISAYAGWDIQKGNSNLVLAVIDAGLSWNHPEFSSRLALNTADPINGIDDDNNGYIDDYRGWNFAELNNNPEPTNNGHGNAVAALAIAQSENNQFGTGLTIGGKLLPVKVFGNRSAGYEGLYYAAMRGANVINLSWGRSGGSASQYEQDVVNYAVLNKGAVVVAAAGNTAQELDFYPSSYDNVISVGHVKTNDEREGTGTWSYEIDLMAPGSGLQGLKKDYPTLSYGAMDPGSSYASPLVAATAMLVKSQFPTLTPRQIAEVIRVNTDDIYAIAANSTYRGQLGSGRLNVQRALQRQMNLALRAVDPIFRGTRGDYITRNDTIRFSATFQNILNPLAGLQVQVQAVTSNIMVLSGTLNAPTVPTNGSFTNANQPFVLRTVGNPTQNERAILRLVYTASGGYRDEQYVTLFLNNNYLNLNTRYISTSVTSFGAIGYADDFNRQGQGFLRRTKRMLASAGLMIATGPTRVSNAVVDTSSRDRHFLTVDPLRNVPGTLGETRAVCSFTDGAGTPPIGVFVKQTASVYDEAAAGNGLVLQYEIFNQSGRAMDSLLVGLYTDWDINDPSRNRANWDAANQTGFVEDVGSSGIVAGTAVLGNVKPTYFVIDVVSNLSGNINVFDGFSLAEKYRALNGGRMAGGTGPEGANVITVTGARLYNVLPGERRKVAFVMLADSGRTRLNSGLSALRSKLRPQNQGPAPVVSDQTICRNQTVLINPTNGLRFRFYGDAAMNQLLHEGRVLQLDRLGASRTVWVTNVDSLFEGPATPVNITVQGPQALYAANPSSLDLGQGSGLVQFYRTGNGAAPTSWEWLINGVTYTDPAPNVTFTDTGRYSVRLVVNGAGCSDTITGTYRVARVTSVNKNVAAGFRWYPQPSAGQIIWEGADLSGLTLTTLQGKSVFETKVASDIRGLTLPATLPNGLYLVQFTDQRGYRWQERLVLTR